jgi:hypothetical protein
MYVQVCERYVRLMVETRAKVFISAQNTQLIVNY